MCLSHPLPDAHDDQALPPFAAQLITTLNHAGTALALSIGHRTGLFDAMRGKSPATVDEWAAITGLNHRYLAEWFGAMATAGVITIDDSRYALPDEHSAFLGEHAPAGSMSGMMQWIGVLAPVESLVVECFETGGGVPYSAYPRFHAVMEEESRQTFDVDATLGLVPGLAEKLDAGIDVLDVGCGRGRALRLLAERFPGSRFTGYDLSGEAIGTARAAAVNLSNVAFHVKDCMEMREREAFDLVLTFDAIHDQPHPARLLANIRRALRPRGVYVAQDIWAHSKVADNLDHPLGPFLYTISLMHCMTVSLAQGGVGLGAAWGEEQAKELMTAAGFGSIEVHRLEHDIQNAYYVCRA
jgi:SAM-dependent methyltransferase